MANFVTADDKRIYDLQEIIGEFLSSSFVLDKTGNISAKRITGQNLLDGINAGLAYSISRAGNINPDNALGVNGDVYFKVLPDSLTMFQKIAGVYATVFNLPLSGKSNLIYTQSDVVSDYIVIPLTDANILTCWIISDTSYPDKSLFAPIITVVGSEYRLSALPIGENFTLKINYI